MTTNATTNDYPLAASEANGTPQVTVVIPTRDRGSGPVGSLARLLAVDDPRFAARVVDQSVDHTTQEALAKLGPDPRLHYQRSATRGISAALNVGIEAAESELIAITGDDCEPSATWLNEMIAPFALDPRIGVVFGTILAGAHDESVGFVAGYECSDVVHAKGIRDQHRIGGTSACMALRKHVWEALGGFDEMLGVGAPLRAAEDLDFTLRALLHGVHVYETPAAKVVHRGFYPWAERAALIERNWFGTGAAFAKCLRRGQPAALLNLGHLAWRWASAGPSPVAAGLGDRPVPGSMIAAALTRGFLSGVRTPVDRASGHYRRPSGAAADSTKP